MLNNKNVNIRCSFVGLYDLTTLACSETVGYRESPLGMIRAERHRFDPRPIHSFLPVPAPFQTFMISLSYSVFKSSARCSEQSLCGYGENLEKMASHLKNLFVSLTQTLSPSDS